MKGVIDEELVSVIVPIYNAEKYLRECVDSILSNTYHNLEIILINDGSSDRSGAICDEYLLKDNRICVIHQKNEGLVGARNSGLEVANGTYVSFVDADDAISSVFYETMVYTIKAGNADMVGCNATRDLQNLIHEGSCPPIHYVEDYETMLAVITTAPQVRKFSWTSCNVWNKLYRREFIRELFHPECLMCEDLRFNWDYIKNCSKIAIIQSPLYFYRINDESIMGIYRRSLSKLEHGIRHAELWAKIAAEPHSDPKLNLYLKARAVYMAHGALWRIYLLNSQAEYQIYVRETRQLIKMNFDEFLHEKDSYNFKIRVTIFLCRYAFPIWSTVAKVLGKYL